MSVTIVTENSRAQDAESENSKNFPKNFGYDSYGFLTDMHGVAANPIAGEMFTNGDRLFKIEGGTRAGDVRIQFELTEILMPPGWHQVIAAAVAPHYSFEQLQKRATFKPITISATVFENQFLDEKVWWWWPGKK